jgi:hypothetical protein
MKSPGINEYGYSDCPQANSLCRAESALFPPPLPSSAIVSDANGRLVVSVVAGVSPNHENLDTEAQSWSADVGNIWESEHG